MISRYSLNIYASKTQYSVGFLQWYSHQKKSYVHTLHSCQQILHLSHANALAHFYLLEMEKKKSFSQQTSLSYRHLCCYIEKKLMVYELYSRCTSVEGDTVLLGGTDTCQRGRW